MSMKQKKIEKRYVYEGLGFPILLTNVPMVEIRGVWTLDIDLNFLQKVVLIGLAYQPFDLTGNQIRFIRSWLRLTQVAFGHHLGVTHPAVVKWEKTNNLSSKMNVSTQRELRLLLLDKLLIKDEDFRKAFKIVLDTEYSQDVQPLSFDAPLDLMAI